MNNHGDYRRRWADRVDDVLALLRARVQRLAVGLPGSRGFAVRAVSDAAQRWLSGITLAGCRPPQAASSR